MRNGKYAPYAVTGGGGLFWGVRLTEGRRERFKGEISGGVGGLYQLCWFGFRGLAGKTSTSAWSMGVPPLATPSSSN